MWSSEPFGLPTALSASVCKSSGHPGTGGVASWLSPRRSFREAAQDVAQINVGLCDREAKLAFDEGQVEAQLAHRVKQFGSFESQGFAQVPSEAHVQTAGLLVQRGIAFAPELFTGRCSSRQGFFALG